MKFEIVNKYSEARVLRAPVCESPFNVRELVSALTDATSFIFPDEKNKFDRARVMVAVRLFERFLKLSKATEVNLHEDLLERFRASFLDQLMKRNGARYSEEQVNKVIDSIRCLTNGYFYSRKLILRKLLVRKAYLKYERFLSFSKLTQELLIAYEGDGRHVEATKIYFDDSKGNERFRYQFRRKLARLSSYNRRSRIGCTLTLLSVLNKTGIEQIQGDDLVRFLEVYRDKNEEETAKNCLAALFSIVANGIDLGILKENPFDNFRLEKRNRKSRNDFVTPEEIEKLFNLDSVDWKNDREVRGRSLTALIYDTGLRAGTITQLRLEDVSELPDSRYKLTIKGEYLKGNKEDKVVYLLFQETIPLLRHWMHVVRPKLSPQTDRLFLSWRGKPLTVTGVEDIVNECCRRLNIRTFKGKIPSPHTFRHTLPTLNTEPYGKCLASRLMQHRLGHMDFSTFEKIYVHNNPLSEMKEYKRLFAMDSEEHWLNQISKEDLWKLLDCLSSAKQSSIRDIKDAYERELEKKNRQKKNLKRVDILTEEETISTLACFQVDYRSLRAWGLREGICRMSEHNGKKNFVYDESRIQEILKSYIVAEEALRKFLGSRTEFYRCLKKCQRIIIGRKTLISKDDYLRFMIDDMNRYKIRMGQGKAGYASVKS